MIRRRIHTFSRNPETLCWSAMMQLWPLWGQRLAKHGTLIYTDQEGTLPSRKKKIFYRTVRPSQVKVKWNWKCSPLNLISVDMTTSRSGVDVCICIYTRVVEIMRTAAPVLYAYMYCSCGWLAGRCHEIDHPPMPDHPPFANCAK